jgi:transcriptional regulator with XRE-family HTH domain
MGYELKNNPFRDRRMELRYSYRELVKKIKEDDPEGKGISTMTVYAAEKNLNSIKLKSFLMLCNALNISPRTFFTGKGGK